jgi:8-oxo-dGTP pyrophosphatase MutT (NUDIX family)
MDDKKQFIYDKCDNCGTIGHDYKQCNVPITSWGIILVKIIKDIDDSIKIGDKTNIDVSDKTEGIYINDTTYLKTICNKMNTIKFLLIRRKYSLGYTEFIRGNYKKDNIDGIIFLFQQMTPIEIKNINESTFDELWDDFWTPENKKKNHIKKKYFESKENFESLKNKKDVELSLEFYTKNVKSLYDIPEWGFPKGRKMKGETDMDCAIREFGEETNFKINDIKIMSNVKPIIENIVGTNGVSYRHIYFLAENITDIYPEIGINNANEIGDIGFFTYDESMTILREYHVEKKNITKNIYLYLLESLSNNNDVEEIKQTKDKDWVVESDDF